MRQLDVTVESFALEALTGRKIPAAGIDRDAEQPCSDP